LTGKDHFIEFCKHSGMVNTKFKKSSGRVICPTQRPLADNKQHSQETDVHAPEGFETVIPANGQPQTHAIDRVATEISIMLLPMCYYCKMS